MYKIHDVSLIQKFNPLIFIAFEREKKTFEI